MKSLRQITILAAALIVTACGSSNEPAVGGGAPRLTRGAVTAKSAGAIVVNGVTLSTAGISKVRVDDDPNGTLEDVKPGDVVRVKGTFDDRAGAATEIEVEHGVEGRVEVRGTDFIEIAGQRIQVDDTTHLDDRLGGFDGVGVGSIVVVSGTPVAPSGADDKGGLRASRLERSPREDDGVVANDDDFDVKGFVSAIDTGAKTFQLRATPDAASYYLVSYATLPDGVVNGAYVEVHSADAGTQTSPTVRAITATSIQLEDGVAGNDVELEGYVTSISGSRIVVAGVTVQTSGATYRLGSSGDLVVGVKVEVEGLVDASGVLHASKISFRPGVRLTGVISGYTGTSMTVLGQVVQLPVWLDNDVSDPLADGVKVEVRGNPSVPGGPTDVVAYRLVNPSGNADAVFVRAMVEAKPGAEILQVLGFAVSPRPAGSGGVTLKNADGSVATDRAAFFAAIQANLTVVKVRANTIGDVNTGAMTWTADEIQIEGNDD